MFHPEFGSCTRSTPWVGLLLLFFVAVVGISASVQVAWAITIDSFTAEQLVRAGSSSSQSGSVSDPLGQAYSMLRGKRSIRAAASSSSVQGLNITADVRDGQFSHSQDSRVTGTSLIIWDGDLDADKLKANGLGGIDFTQDGASEFQLEITSFDFPNRKSVKLRVTVYSSDREVSEGSLTLDAPVFEKTSFTIPFSSLVKTQAATQPVNLKSVGAITLLIDGSTTPASDLVIDWFGTNTCRIVPNDLGKVVDECGQCGGDNSTCKDCRGIPNGPNLPGTQCDSGLLGACAVGAYSQACACIFAAPTVERCDSIDNDCDGLIDEGFSDVGQTCSIGQGACQQFGTFYCSNIGEVKCSASFIALEECESPRGCDGIRNSGMTRDICGVCGGDGTSCLDCKGIPNGVAEIDLCGVCGGDGTSCLDCRGIPHGDAVVDQCGICEGDGTICLDCKGTPNGSLKVDICGICGGDGTSCLDCNGVPRGTAKEDRCGVCGGDGMSCISCQTQDFSSHIERLAKFYERQESDVLRLIRRLSSYQLSGSAQVRNQRAVRQLLQSVADTRTMAIGSGLNQIPKMITTCVTKQLCQPISTVPSNRLFRDGATRLNDLGRNVGTRLRSVGRRSFSPVEGALLARIRSIRDASIKLSLSLPVTTDSCDKK